MIKLSKFTQPILESTILERNTCKLVGEFAGNDVALMRGDQYYVLRSGKSTFVRMKLDGHTYANRLGENRHVHVFEVLRRTPCSYVAEYKHSFIICHSTNRRDVFKFRNIFSHLKKRTRRFFPNRKLDIQMYLQSYVNMPFDVIPDEVKINFVNGNFHLDLEPGMRKYFHIT